MLESLGAKSDAEKHSCPELFLSLHQVNAHGERGLDQDSTAHMGRSVVQQMTEEHGPIRRGRAGLPLRQ